MPTLTPVFSFNLPVEGADLDVWGGLLNDNWTAADGLFNDIINGADAITPNLGAGWEIVGVPVTVTAAELNILDGATLTVTELNILDGATLSTAELNILDGATLSTAELNILDGVTATATELNEASMYAFIERGALTGTEVVVEIPADIETVIFEVWGFQPNVSGDQLEMLVGSGTVGSPVWNTSYNSQNMGIVAGVSTVTEVSPVAIALTPAVSSTLPAYAKGQLSPFNTAGILPAGEVFRTGRNSSGNNYLTTIGIRTNGSANAMSLIKFFTTLGVMDAGEYRITGYRMP